jgi:hypothetical protein
MMKLMFDTLWMSITKSWLHSFLLLVWTRCIMHPVYVWRGPAFRQTRPGVRGGGRRGLLQTDPTRHSRISTDRARRGGWGREKSVIDRPGPIFHLLLHRPLPSPTPQNLCHRHRHLNGCCGPLASPVGGCLP